MSLIVKDNNLNDSEIYSSIQFKGSNLNASYQDNLNGSKNNYLNFDPLSQQEIVENTIRKKSSNLNIELEKKLRNSSRNIDIFSNSKKLQISDVKMSGVQEPSSPNASKKIGNDVKSSLLEHTASQEFENISS